MCNSTSVTFLFKIIVAIDVEFKTLLYFIVEIRHCLKIKVLFKIIVETSCCLDFHLGSFQQHNLVELLVYWISIKTLLELIVKLTVS